ncbi:hypothetical protein [Puia sp.]|jgi:tetratricopeptide (TPR) repeat protein|uniref:tetratricopeptide repeat protein n=1 Tax=Puia sp. TaxID=2045100 RepID=UPI002F40FCAF
MFRLLFVLLFLSLSTGTRQPVPSGYVRKGEIVDCSSAAETDPSPDAAGRDSPIFPGWGHYHYPISTTNDSAQYYFDQGLSLYYGYHLTESLASFREASLRDSSSLMTYWGQALAMGPYYNSTFTYKMPSWVLPVLKKMNRLAGNAPQKEKDLAAVMDRRYSDDVSDSHRADLNSAYSEAMKRMIAKYPGDRDIKALYIDGVMTEHAWDMFDPAGEPKPWTPELVRYCAEILAADANHPAALHYQIHLLEASRHPEATLASAEKLPLLMPGVPHMVHMASHSFQRTGLYVRGVAINDSASEAQREFVRLAPNLHLGSSIIHYHAVESFCALTGGMYDVAMREAEECRRIAEPRMRHEETYLQYLYTMPVFVDIRMRKWQSILDRAEPDSAWTYAWILNEFARGMAFVRKGDVPAATACLDGLRLKMKDPVLTERIRPHNAPIAGASVAAALLEGEILFARGNNREANTAFEQAIRLEDAMTYGEPKDWVLPARHFAGACLLRQKNPVEAEKLYRDDLVHNPGNGWSMLGLAQCLEAQHKNGAAEYRAKANAAFAKAEEMPEGSAY